MASGDRSEARDSKQAQVEAYTDWREQLKASSTPIEKIKVCEAALNYFKSKLNLTADPKEKEKTTAAIAELLFAMLTYKENVIEAGCLMREKQSSITEPSLYSLYYKLDIDNHYTELLLQVSLLEKSSLYPKFQQTFWSFAKMLFGKAVKANKEKRYGDALDLCSRALLLDPNNKKFIELKVALLLDNIAPIDPFGPPFHNHKQLSFIIHAIQSAVQNNDAYSLASFKTLLIATLNRLERLPYAQVENSSQQRFNQCLDEQLDLISQHLELLAGPVPSPKKRKYEGGQDPERKSGIKRPHIDKPPLTNFFSDSPPSAAFSSPIIPLSQPPTVPQVIASSDPPCAEGLRDVAPG